MTLYAVGLGSNLGNRVGHLRYGLTRLRGLGDVTGVSGLYETAPVGGPEQDPYLNAIVTLETGLSPHELLDTVNQIESDAGRERKAKWGPRTLDLDLIASDGLAVSDDRLSIPHPRAAEREFVLRPLCDVWPDALVTPGEPAREALAGVEDQEVDLLAARWEEDTSWPGRALVAVQFTWFLVVALAMAWDGSAPAGDADLARIVGMLLAIVGAGMAFISARRLGPALTALPEPKEEVNLIETGFYTKARHPIYGGVTLFILGASLIVDSLAATVLSLALVPFFLLKSSYEERRLRMKYSSYRAYRQRVRHRIIPYVI